MTIEAKYCFDKMEARVYFITLVLWSVHMPILNAYLNLLSVSVSVSVICIWICICSDVVWKLESNDLSVTYELKSCG